MGVRQQMGQDELKAWVAMHEFPNRIRLFRSEVKVDLDGKTIPTKVSLRYLYAEGVKMNKAGNTMYGLYMDDQENTFWVSLSDADYFAQRDYGYTVARLRE